MTFKAELDKLNDGAHAAFRAWEQDLISFSAKLSDALQAAVGVGEGSVDRIGFDTNRLPHGARPSPLNGFVDGKGYHFVLRFTYGQVWVQYAFVANKVDGAYDVTCDANTWRIDLDSAASLQPLVEDIQDALRSAVTERFFASATGFKPAGS